VACIRSRLYGEVMDRTAQYETTIEYEPPAVATFPNVTRAGGSYSIVVSYWAVRSMTSP